MMDGRGLVRRDLAFLVAGEGRFHILMIIARRGELGLLRLQEADAFRRRGELHVHLTKPLKGGLVLSCGARFCRLSGALSRPYTGLSGNASLPISLGGCINAALATGQDTEAGLLFACHTKSLGCCARHHAHPICEISELSEATTQVIDNNSTQPMASLRTKQRKNAQKDTSAPVGPTSFAGAPGPFFARQRP